MTQATSYQFVAEDLPVGIHQFWLKQVDLAGTSTLHGPIRVHVQMQEALSLEPPAPNPVRGRATLSFAVKDKARVTVVVYGLLGRRGATLFERTPTPGESTRLHLDVSRPPSGPYVIRLRASGQTWTRRLTAVR